MKSLKRNVERRAVYSSKDHDAAVATLELRPDVRTAESGRSGPCPDVNGWSAYVSVHRQRHRLPSSLLPAGTLKPNPRLPSLLATCSTKCASDDAVASLLGLMTVCFAAPHPSSYPLPLLVILQIHHNLISWWHHCAATVHPFILPCHCAG